jgi:hypothetical protein
MIMTCTKTGCHAFLRPYNEYVFGDAFEVDGVAIFRIVERRREKFEPTVHYTIDDYSNWFDMGKSLSTLVVPRGMFTRHV